MKESRLHEVLTALIDIVWLGLLWLVCSLPVVTLGAASAALYYSMVKCVRHERFRATKAFFQSFRRNFRQGTLLWLLCLGYALVGLGNVWTFGQMGVKPGDLLFYVSRFFFVPLPMLLPWIFAFLSRFENSVRATLRFSLYLAVRHFGATLLLTAELLGFALLCWLLPQIIPLLPGALCLLMSVSLEPPLRELSRGQGTAEDWYNEP